MSTSVIREIAGRAIAVRGNDIDTDRIIPARYMKELTFDSLGQYSFYDQRFDASGKAVNHPFNDSRFQGASILLVKKNFGCGSSREHAPQALMRWGIKAIVGESFAEIFAGNCTAIGVPTLTVGPAEIEELMKQVEADPQTELRIDLDSRKLQVGSSTVSVNLPDSQAQMLLKGTWDTTTTLLGGLKEIQAAAAHLPYVKDFPYDTAARS
ncbi:MAG: 3-isopropylmalate dehydratase small subunit [Spirochaetaceae bacterium]|nr:MAG: 3-isopropylmalate dehydratase small subunit [Spirochaetaceae bacterium]